VPAAVADAPVKPPVDGPRPVPRDLTVLWTANRPPPPSVRVSFTHNLPEMTFSHPIQARNATLTDSEFCFPPTGTTPNDLTWDAWTRALHAGVPLFLLPGNYSVALQLTAHTGKKTQTQSATVTLGNERAQLIAEMHMAISHNGRTLNFGCGAIKDAAPRRAAIEQVFGGWHAVGQLLRRVPKAAFSLQNLNLSADQILELLSGVDGTRCRITSLDLRGNPELRTALKSHPKKVASGFKALGAALEQLIVTGLAVNPTLELQLPTTVRVS